VKCARRDFRHRLMFVDVDARKVTPPIVIGL